MSEKTSNTDDELADFGDEDGRRCQVGGALPGPGEPEQEDCGSGLKNHQDQGPVTQDGVHPELHKTGTFRSGFCSHFTIKIVLCNRFIFRKSFIRSLRTEK